MTIQKKRKRKDNNTVAMSYLSTSSFAAPTAETAAQCKQTKYDEISKIFFFL
jgi:hypothetical protein